MGQDFYIAKEQSKAFEMLISQGPAGNSSQGFVEISGPARYTQRFSLDLNQPSTSETSVLAKMKDFTFKIIEIRIMDTASFHRISNSMKHNNIKFLAKLVDRQEPRPLAPEKKTFSPIKQEPGTSSSPASSLKRGPTREEVQPAVKIKKEIKQEELEEAVQACYVNDSHLQLIAASIPTQTNF